jgi:hypothetical protein
VSDKLRLALIQLLSAEAPPSDTELQELSAALHAAGEGGGRGLVCMCVDTPAMGTLGNTFPVREEGAGCVSLLRSDTTLCVYPCMDLSQMFCFVLITYQGWSVSSNMTTTCACLRHFCRHTLPHVTSQHQLLPPSTLPPPPPHTQV